MKWFKQLEQLVHSRIQHSVGNEERVSKFFCENELAAWERKMNRNKERNSEIVKTKVKANVISERREGNQSVVDYVLHLQHLIKQKKGFYIEESLEERKAIVENNELIDDVMNESFQPETKEKIEKVGNEESRTGYQYDRRAAVQYAEEWWNSYNPKYKKFDVDCTNFISQCLHAGGAPMTGFGNRSKGWWFDGDNWSYSWSVAHAFRWYLSGSQDGLRAKQVDDASNLRPGDVICYDFEGDGRFDHSTIVVAKDENGEPLVNAHTSNSRMRYWAYEDSTAWTPDIKYKFFTIVDG